MIDHHSVKHTRGGIFVSLPFFPVLEFRNSVGALGILVPHLLSRLGQLVLPGTGRTEIGVQTSAAPGGLDDEDRLFEHFLTVNAERELRADLCVRRTESGCQCARLHKHVGVLVAAATERRNPDILADPWLALGIAHRREQRRRQRVFADVIERRSFRMPLHIGLARHDEDLQFLGSRLGGPGGPGTGHWREPTEQKQAEGPQGEGI